MPLGNLNIWHKLFAYLVAKLFSFRNALQGLVKEFKKDCHIRFYTHGTLVCTAEYPGVGTSLSIFAPVSENFTGFHTHTE